jgi:hypothetical protein
VVALAGSVVRNTDGGTPCASASVCRLEVDDKLELDRGLNGKLARLRSLEDAIDMGGRAPGLSPKEPAAA